jgi:hypothetical protein
MSVCDKLGVVSEIPIAAVIISIAPVLYSNGHMACEIVSYD